jgi:serine phosphatase RsbU (regulator of sigma subunit)
MVGAALLVLALALVVRAWRAGRRADPSRVPGLLVRLAVASIVATVLLPPASRASGPAMALLAAAAGLAALVAFDALVSLALWGPFRRRGVVLRAPFAVTSALLAVFGGPWTGIALVGATALISYRWRSALRTVALFRASLGATALALVVILYPSAGAGGLEGPLAPVGVFVRIVLLMVRVYALVGILKTFMAFIRDPSLGIRTVTRRLALSHALVLIVPLFITLTLWVATTFLGVNADRALAGSRLLQREGDQLAAGLAAALDADPRGGAAIRLAGAHARLWPGTRLWIDRGAGLERVAGDSIVGEAFLAGWGVGLDSLPDRGVVGLRGARWLGAAVRSRSDGRAAVLLVPIRSALDSSLTPVLEARFQMREGDEREVSGAADSLASARDSVAAVMRDVEALRAGSAGRRSAPSGGRRQITVSRAPRDAPITVGVGSERDTIRTAESLASSGIASAAGLEYRGGRWRRSPFMLVARADPATTLAGLFANLRDNPLQAVPIAMLGLIALALLPVAVLDFTMVGGMGRSIGHAVGAVRDGAAALGRGELGYRIGIEGDDELWETARQFNRMADGLERARALEKERDRLEGELELARRIQQRLLPAGPPEIPGLEIAGRYEPARVVGGDYYDHFDLGGGRALLVIADVSGKGVPAALLMSGFRASLMSQDARALGPERLAERVNEFLHRSVETGKFVTAFLGFLDAGTGRLVYANAGHNPPALLRAEGGVEWLTAGGVVLGIMPHFRFESGEARVERGDLLALYTDGVTEGANADGELWGDERLVGALARLRGRPCAEAAEALVREVRDFEGETGPADDITVLLARRT